MGKGDAVGIFEGSADLIQRDPNDINDHLKVCDNCLILIQHAM